MKVELEMYGLKDANGELVRKSSSIDSYQLPAIHPMVGVLREATEDYDSDAVRVRVTIEEIKPRPRVYIAGPITKGDLFDNLKAATEAFLVLMKAGFAPFCPHWSAYAGGPYDKTIVGIDGLPSATPWAWAERLPAGTSHEDWIGVDLPWVEVSEAVLRLPGESVGADKETALANRLGIPVFSSIEALTQHFNQ